MALQLPSFKSLSKRDQFFVAIGIGVVLLVVSDRLVLGPWLNYQKKLKKEIKVLEQKVAGQSSLLSRQASVIVDEEMYKKYIHLGLASEVDIAAFLKEVEGLAAQARVSLQEVRPLATESGEWYREYGLEVHYLATLAEWTRFIYLLETSLSLLTIERVDLGLEKEDSKTLKGVLRIKRLVVLNEPQTAHTEDDE